MSSTNGTILEDDQQLYDWGIENRLDQYEYYQVSSGLKISLKKWFLLMSVCHEQIL